MKERGQERIGWERIITFCVAKEKENLFNAERLRISYETKRTSSKYQDILCLSVQKAPRDYLNVYVADIH